MQCIFGPPRNLDRLKRLTKKTPPRNLDRSKNRNLERPKKDHRRVDPKRTQKGPGLLQGNSWPIQAFGPILKLLLGLWQLLGNSWATPSRPWTNSQATPKSTSRSHIWHNYLTHICLPRIFNFYRLRTGSTGKLDHILDSSSCSWHCILVVTGLGLG